MESFTKEFISNLLGWPKKFIGVSHNIIHKNLNEIFSNQIKSAVKKFSQKSLGMVRSVFLVIV